MVKRVLLLVVVAGEVLPAIRQTGKYEGETEPKRKARLAPLTDWPPSKLPIPDISLTKECLEVCLGMLEKAGHAMSFESERMRVYLTDNKLGDDLCTATCLQIEAAQDALKLSQRNIQAALCIKKASDKAANLQGL